ncbi:hypothetical protein [Humibacter ginsenosidimutans]|uniref:Uncharacterized protein n=1 Tax=Humibacter ginsenosidimutans TaxID=2599293 RepID=A0A5B8M3F5_9MICO|nr:hypothetical protein [Humibacter ginsenosidimutans]QDZ15328.1 hypothetical protein FPZ11_11635 [Humibacter ginsenosidimutans]
MTRRTVILAGAPQYAGVAMAATIVPAVAQASTPERDTYADAVGQRFEAASEYGRYDLTLASVESLSQDATDAATRFGLMFAATAPPPAGVYRLSAVGICSVPDAQLFVAASAQARGRASRRRSSSRSLGRRS